ncbi:MAG: hypothetical protein JRE40_04555, partial [Deltaproteobacteria bacterium]|nr:hypothetical protein [Deltaproteobacteria bacterium]
VITPDGKGKVLRQNILERLVVVDLGDGKEIEVPVDEIQREDKSRRPAIEKKKQ